MKKNSTDSSLEKNISTYKILLIVSVFFIQPFLSKSLSPVAQKTAGQKASSFVPVRLFEITENSKQKSLESSEIAASATVLEFRPGDSKKIVASRPEAIQFVIPLNTGSMLELLLVRSEIFTPDFSVVTSGEGEILYSGGVHYQGIVKGDNSSLAAISIFETDVMGIIATDEGNFTLGKLENDALLRHVYYKESELKNLLPPDCHTQNDGGTYKPDDIQPPPSFMSVNCIRLFWEVNYDIYTNKGSVTNTVNYVTGLFNQSAIIYTNDGIPVELSEIFVWTSTSPYTSTSTSGLLGQFQSNRNTINGDLGHLLGYVGGGGVAAGFSGLCAANLDNSQCYSMIYSSYSNFPVYSWSVEVVTHEQGHLMGSRHTHACVWNGNNTAIDNCGPTAGYGYEGSCSGAPTPVNGGTIMSYCHLVGSVGINFNNGFGAQPTAVILNNYNNASCLSACIGTACMPPANMYTTGQTTTAATLNWAAVTGATGYNIRYRITGTSTWSTASTAATSYTITGLTPGANYEWQVQSVCGGSATSIFTISTLFVSVPTTCNTPAGLSTTSIGSTSATFNWGAVTGAISYTIHWRAIGSPTWIQASTTATSYFASGLAATTAYEWQVQTVCSGGGTSAYSASVNFSTNSGPCYPPTNLTTTGITQSSATFNWGAATGAVSYGVRYRVTSTSTWTTATTSALSYTATGLTPFTSYEWQVQTNCTGGQSSFGNSVTFTTLCSPPSATISPAGTIILCSGATQLLNANTGAGYTYQWKKNSLAVSGATAASYLAITSGIYSVVVTNSSGCYAPSAETIVAIGQQAASIRLDAEKGKDAMIWMADAQGFDNENTNYGSSDLLLVHSWTTQSLADNGRSLIQFDLSAVPPGAILQGAFLSLYNNPTTTSFSGQHQNYSGTNESYLRRVTSAWNESTVTWNTMPTSTTVNSVSVPASVSPHQDFLNMNVTQLVTDMINNPSTSDGFIMQLQNETPYKGLVFATSEYPDSTKRPRLVLFFNTPVTASITAAGPTVFCAGGSVVLNANTGSGLSYQWKLNGNNIAGATASSYTANTTGNYTCTVSIACNSAVSNTIAVTLVASNPTTPSSITGSALPCANSAGVPYSCPAVANATSYNWTVPATATIASGQGSNSITVNFGSSFSSGSIKVQSVNCYGSSSFRSLTVRGKPSTPGIITGPATGVCAGTNGVAYSIPAVTGASTYTWTAPINATIATGQGTTSVTVNYSASFVSGPLSVTAGNTCGNSAARTLNIYSVPTTPGTITGSSIGVCAGTNGVAYSIAAASGATSYIWTAPPNASIATGQGTSSVTVNYSASFTTGTLSVKAVNSCGLSGNRTLSIKSVPTTPGTMTGPATVCANQTGVAYSIVAISGATTYNWVVPAGATVATGQGTTAVTVNFSASAGSVKVQSGNACGYSSFRTKTVTVNCREAHEDFSESTFAVSVYPNPTNHNFSFLFHSDEKNINAVCIIDLTGREIEVYQNINADAEFNCGANLSAGMYFAEIIAGNSKKTIRLIKE